MRNYVTHVFRCRASLLACFALSAIPLLSLTGCETDSFVDPSVLGRWERTPTKLPILDRLDVIDEKQERVDGLTQVRPEDLIPEIREYVLGPGDAVSFNIFELVVPNVEFNQGRRIDELGDVRLPILGKLRVAGFTASQLEKELVELLANRGILKDARISVTTLEQRQNTFSVIGEPGTASTAIGTYQIIRPEFRLIDAMALARGVPGQTRKLYIIRQVQPNTGVLPQLVPDETGTDGGNGNDGSANIDAAALIDDLLQGTGTPESSAAAPEPLERGLGNDAGSSPWVNVDGEWIKLDAGELAKRQAADGSEPAIDEIQISQRVIEVPYDRLLEGDMRFNIVIRAGDIIRVPSNAIGNVYVGGAISRPGTYGLPGERELTLKQLIISAGGLNQVAIPQRVDLIRRVGTDQEATMRLNLAAIFEGTQPDFFLKTNDTINIGTNFPASFLAAVRNSFRFSYGFGFIADQNFGNDLFPN